jgi:hypothetical protein
METGMESELNSMVEGTGLIIGDINDGTGEVVLEDLPTNIKGLRMSAVIAIVSDGRYRIQLTIRVALTRADSEDGAIRYCVNDAGIVDGTWMLYSEMLDDVSGWEVTAIKFCQDAKDSCAVLDSVVGAVI